MADPTLKDVMKVLAAMQHTMAALATKEQVDSVRTELIAKIATARAELRDELASQIKAVANTRRTDDAIRALESEVELLKKDVATLKGRPSARPTRPARRR